MLPPRCLVVLVALVLVSAEASAVKVQVRGGTVLEARGVPKDGKLEVRGTLKDDTGRLLGQSRVRARLLAERNGPIVTIGRPTGCQGTSASSLHVSSDELIVDTDGAGQFCFVLAEVERRGMVRLEFEGDRFYEKSEAAIDVDASRRSLLLSFQPEPRTLPLERESHSIWIDTRIEPADEAPSETLQLRLVIEEKNGRRRELGRTSVRAGERAPELVVRSKDLGAPGPATLAAEFAGSDAIQPARRAIPVERTARVTLSIAGPPPPADPSEGVELDIAVGSELGAVPSGTVEAIVGGESAGAATVVAGAAHVIATFPVPTTGVVPVSLRYLPEGPWWLPGDPLEVAVPISPPSPWRRIPWVLAALAVGFWVVRTWWRPTRTEKPERERTSIPPGRPAIDVVELGPVRSGWKGRVLDAHEGTPIEAARVSVLIPAFGGDGCATSSATDDQGRFELEHVERTEGARLEVTARWHSTLVKPLPPPGQVVVSVVSRRRALLGRLVDWALRMGRPWTQPGDPTPGHVAKVARSRQAQDVEGWAESVENAAFGPLPPDADIEQAVREREPGRR